MRHANPFRMTADLGMLLAFTLTALLGLSSAAPTAVAGAQALAPTGPHALTAAGKGAAVFDPNVATATIEVELLRPNREGSHHSRPRPSWRMYGPRSSPSASTKRTSAPVTSASLPDASARAAC